MSPLDEWCYDPDGHPISFERYMALVRDKLTSVEEGREPWWRVGRTEVGPFTVSTVWTGIDTDLGQSPLFFETMVFVEGEIRDWLDSFTARYPSKEAALAGHDRIVAEVREHLDALQFLDEHLRGVEVDLAGGDHAAGGRVDEGQPLGGDTGDGEPD